MKKEELRIGNWYHSVKFGVPVKCDLSDLYNLSAIADGADDDPPIDEMFEPIILTEEWLEKLKFFFVQLSGDKSYKKYINPFGGLRIRINSYNNNYFWFVFMGSTKRINYVHQLQNLYFGLTDRDL